LDLMILEVFSNLNDSLIRKKGIIVIEGSEALCISKA